MGPLCIIIGPPGAGKSTVARLLAQGLKSPLIDTDELVSTAANKSVSDIFIEDGEQVFRALEARSVEQAMTHEGAVVSLGGGAVMTPSTRQLLEATETPVVFLNVSISGAAPRIGFNRDRPLLVGNPRAQWISLMEQRRSTYEALADLQVDTDEQSPEEVAAAISTWLGER